MLTRRTLAAALFAAIVMPSLAAAQATTPSAATIERKLEAAPRVKLRPDERVTIREFKRRPDLRRMARSIDIQSINFAFGSAAISPSQYGKIENIADALQRILRRDPPYPRADRRPYRRGRLIPVEPDPVGTAGRLAKAHFGAGVRRAGLCA